MSNTSASGGYLLPAKSPAPLYDDAFEDFLQSVVVGITGMSPKLVRPRWTPEPANMPDAGADWIAFGVTSWDPDTYAVETENPDGSASQTRYETDEVLVSFYGPNASAIMGVFRDGLQVAQNRAAMDAVDVKLQKTGSPVNAPALVKEKWQKRVDLPCTFRRAIRREYPVLYLLTANGILYCEGAPLITEHINT